jgi:2,5-diamino-6-(ribosylamino)-4(3H)-pyrimidinone 5'-phosphate reductase
MLPKVIIFNTISIDGAIKDFDINIPLHYEVASQLGAQVMLVGSDTARTGIELFNGKNPRRANPRTA